MWTARVILWMSNVIIGIIESIIGLRILLKFLNASNEAPFVQWVYETSQSLLTPFEGMLPTSAVPGTEGRLFILEFSALFAFLVYAFIGYLIGELLEYFTYRRTIYYPDEDEEVVIEERPIIRKRRRTT